MAFNLLVAAGSETTRNSITAGVLAFVEHPDAVGPRSAADRSLLPAAVEEVLRCSSSTTYNRRTATVDVERRGATIRAGDKVVLWWQAANHDPDVFDDPRRFDIGRDPNPHLTFGHGSHFCLGANLARMEMQARVRWAARPGRARRARRPARAHPLEQAHRLPPPPGALRAALDRWTCSTCS